MKFIKGKRKQEYKN